MRVCFDKEELAKIKDRRGGFQPISKKGLIFNS